MGWAGVLRKYRLTLDDGRVLACSWKLQSASVEGGKEGFVKFAAVLRLPRGTYVTPKVHVTSVDRKNGENIVGFAYITDVDFLKTHTAIAIDGIQPIRAGRAGLLLFDGNVLLFDGVPLEFNDDN